MGTETTAKTVAPTDVADVLLRLSNVMSSMHERDLSLQAALSEVSIEGASSEAIAQFQHLDMVTQSHLDFSRLLRTLSDCLLQQDQSFDALYGALTLQSLKNELIDANEDTVEKEEMTLF